MFIIYINDIVRVNDHMFCNMYADDTVIVCSSSDKTVAVEQTHLALKSIEQWCEMNKIVINLKKTKHMWSGYMKKGSRQDICIGTGDIALVDSFVYLGVNIDAKLTFEKFISGTISRVNGRLITLSRIRKMLDLHTSTLIYKQTILPIFDYVSIVVNSSTQRKISKLQPLQNKAVRIIEKKVGYISTEEMEAIHKKLNLKPLNIRRKRFMLKMVYKLSQEEENVNMYRPEIVLRTGPKVKMKVEFTDKQRVQSSPYHMCVKLWDKLDMATQLSNNIYEFKQKIHAMDLSDL